MNPALLRDASVFRESFLATSLRNREAETKSLRDLLSPAIERKPSRNVWMHGPPGSGKTSVAKLLLNEFEDRHS
jgi:Cdc6-like AAA superfamily ATPase